MELGLYKLPVCEPLAILERQYVIHISLADIPDIQENICVSDCACNCDVECVRTHIAEWIDYNYETYRHDERNVKQIQDALANRYMKLAEEVYSIPHYILTSSVTHDMLTDDMTAYLYNDYHHEHPNIIDLLTFGFCADKRHIFVNDYFLHLKFSYLLKYQLLGACVVCDYQPEDMNDIEIDDHYESRKHHKKMDHFISGFSGLSVCVDIQNIIGKYVAEKFTSKVCDPNEKKQNWGFWYSE